MALTSDDITAAVTSAGFEDAESFGQFLSMANLVLRRDAKTAAIAQVQAQQAANAAAASQQIQQLQSEYDAIQQQIITLASA